MKAKGEGCEEEGMWKAAEIRNGEGKGRGSGGEEGGLEKGEGEGEGRERSGSLGRMWAAWIVRRRSCSGPP